MVLVNLRGRLDAHEGLAPFVWLANRLEGKAGALFVLLAGVGISMRSTPSGDDESLQAERRALIERAIVLSGVGLLLVHAWSWDILHFYGVYLLLAVPLLAASRWVLWALAAAAVATGVLLNLHVAPGTEPLPASAGEVVRHLLFDGLHPVFPWFAFLLIGMAIARIDLLDARTCRRTLAGALALGLGVELVDTLARLEQETGALGLSWRASWLRTWPRPPRPLFVVSGAAWGVATLCACQALTRERVERPTIVALVATGQMAFTLYVAHIVAILVLDAHGVLDGMSLHTAFALALGLYLGAVALALWWRRRWRYGPLETLLRQVAARRHPDRRGLRLRER